MTQNKLKKRKGLFGFTIQGAIVYHSKEGREDLWVGPLHWVFVKSGTERKQDCAMKPTVNDPLLPSRLCLLKVPQPSKQEQPSIEHIHL